MFPAELQRAKTVDIQRENKVSEPDFEHSIVMKIRTPKIYRQFSIALHPLLGAFKYNIVFSILAGRFLNTLKIATQLNLIRSDTSESKIIKLNVLMTIKETEASHWLKLLEWQYS